MTSEEIANLNIECTKVNSPQDLVNPMIYNLMIVHSQC